jgi:hypothetical protein
MLILLAMPSVGAREKFFCWNKVRGVIERRGDHAYNNSCVNAHCTAKAVIRQNLSDWLQMFRTENTIVNITDVQHNGTDAQGKQRIA